MNTQLFGLALLEIILTITISVVVFYISYKILKMLFFNNEDISGENIAFTIFTSGIFLSIGIILSEILPSISNVIRLSTTQTEAIDAFQIVKYSGLYLFIGFIAAVLINSSVFLLFSVLTKNVNEFKEIQKNNIAVAMLVVSILISITLIAKNSIALLISSLIPYPEVVNYL
ncbi:MAG: DUF350 domain-containing protein [Flavobacteriales bacterium]|nr:DUF350 domain-containing protein [Ulvibacter sp.]|tara:strand:- start:33 stop:548 length:516 start_codon:yes stop_codon:yes gene_type:complete